MIISTYTITEEYCEGALVILVLETDRGGTKFSTVSAAQEIAKLVQLASFYGRSIDKIR